jgi:hypothetical protein
MERLQVALFAEAGQYMISFSAQIASTSAAQ